jgi:hypothetical protein
MIHLPLYECRGCVQDAIQSLSSKDWVTACKGLTVVRQLALHHRTLCLQNLYAPAVFIFSHLITIWVVLTAEIVMETGLKSCLTW